jgi:hypothetical protein
MRPISILSMLFLLTATTSATVSAEPKASGRTTLRACTGQPLRSGGYRDVQTRLRSREAAADSRPGRVETSYRDSGRHQARAEGAGKPIEAPSRYSMRSRPSCG